jgi:hypothetical protein
MRIAAFTGIILILAMLSSCKEIKTEITEEVIVIRNTFDSPFPKNNKKLSGILGDVLLLKRGDDTLTLKITSTKENNLVLTDVGDTLFFGTVCKYRERYYFTEIVNDTAYRIGAFKIEGNLVYGLTDQWLQHYEIDEIIMKGGHKLLVKYINRDTTVIRLHPDKKEMRKMFTAIFTKVVPDTILSPRQDIKIPDDAETIAESDEKDTGFKVYPNPATDFINIAQKTKSRSSFQLADMNGRTILKGQLNELVNRISLGSQRPGIYLLTVIDEKNGRETEKIIIK